MRSIFRKSLLINMLMAAALVCSLFGTAVLSASASPEYILYGVNSSDDGLSIINPTTGEISYIGPLDPDPDIYTTPVSMAVHPVTQEIYVWNNTDGGPDPANPPKTGVLLRVDKMTGLATQVSMENTEVVIGGLAFTPDGTLYGSGNYEIEEGVYEYHLYEIDINDGSLTPVKQYASGFWLYAMDCDSQGIIYGVRTTSGMLYKIDPSTGDPIGYPKALTPAIGVVGTIAFAPDGRLLGTSLAMPDYPEPGEKRPAMFTIDPVSGDVNDIIELETTAPQGMGFVLSGSQAPVAHVKVKYPTYEGYGVEGEVILFDAGQTIDPDGGPSPLEYRWDFDTDGVYDTDWLPYYQATYSWCDDFTGTATVQVYDGQSYATASAPVTVMNEAPIIDVLEQETFRYYCDFTIIRFTGIGKDPGCDELVVEWDFGDGVVQTIEYFSEYSSVVSHTYHEWGDYTVTLTVTDDDGGVVQGQLPVSFKDKNPPKISCVESVNPHGNIIPGKERDKNEKEKPNENPDGFYQISADDDCDSNPEVYIGTIDDPYMFGPFASEIVIKFTEAPGTEPSIKKIGSYNEQADAVLWHITLPSEPVVTAVDEYGNVTQCKCLVPPPPM